MKKTPKAVESRTKSWTRTRLDKHTHAAVLAAALQERRRS